ncbi:hypothetical protein OAS39_11270 [Pirellulales bacterium]|nr:hypothetical protein [Pirellulales bacterium]
MKLPFSDRRPCTGVLLVAFAVSAVLARGAERPNIVLVMTDDQGYGDFGATVRPINRRPSLASTRVECKWISRAERDLN